MAGLKGKSGPPGNMNAFKHGLAAIQKRREEAVTTAIGLHLLTKDQLLAISFYGTRNILEEPREHDGLPLNIVSVRHYTLILSYRG